jgi:hypothetical protein
MLQGEINVHGLNFPQAPLYFPLKRGRFSIVAIAGNQKDCASSEWCVWGRCAPVVHSVDRCEPPLRPSLLGGANRVGLRNGSKVASWGLRTVQVEHLRGYQTIFLATLLPGPLNACRGADVFLTQLGSRIMHWLKLSSLPCLSP